MTRTSVYVGLMLWGLIIYLFPEDGLMQFLAAVGAIALMGFCVIIINVILEAWDD